MGKARRFKALRKKIYQGSDSRNRDYYALGHDVVRPCWVEENGEKKIKNLRITMNQAVADDDRRSYQKAKYARD